jgi:hypothetical protein
MKKFFEFSREAVIASFWPVVFILMLIAGFKFANPVIGLFVILGSFLLQFIVSRMRLASEHDLPVWSWGHFNEFAAQHYKIVTLITNIVFNLIKVITAICIFFFIYYRFQVNSLSQMGLIFSAFVLLVVMLVMSKRHSYNYREVRAYLSLISLACLMLLTYIAYKSQLIWIPLLLAVVMSGYKGFAELESILTPKLHLRKIVLIFFLIIGTVSTINQFSGQISNFFVFARSFIVKILTYEVVSGLALWLIISGLALSGGLWLLGSYVKTREDEKATAKLKIQEEEAKRKKELAALEFKKEQESMRIEALKDRFKQIAKITSNGDMTSDLLAEVAYIAAHIDVNICKDFSIKKLTEPTLLDLVTISRIKKQIVWGIKLKDVINLYQRLYGASYQDDNLSLLVVKVQELLNLINKFSDFAGYESLVNLIKDTGIPFNKEK